MANLLNKKYSVAPNTTLYSPTEKSYYTTTKDSKVIPLTFMERLNLTIDGIDFRPVVKVSNCIPSTEVPYNHYFKVCKV